MLENSWFSMRLPLMRSMWQAITIRFWLFAIGLACSMPLSAQETKPAFTYKAPVVGAGIFTDELGMLDKEREEYAHNIALFTGRFVNEKKASADSLDLARRFLALSLHLSPRNRKAVVMNFQLQRGILPTMEESDYSPNVLARLMITRGQLLLKSASKEDQMLGRCFSQMAAEIDPSNEDAVYASELLRLDKKQITWSELTDVKPEPIPNP